MNRVVFYLLAALIVGAAFSTLAPIFIRLFLFGAIGLFFYAVLYVLGHGLTFTLNNIKTLLKRLKIW